MPSAAGPDSRSRIIIGTAGWSLSRFDKPRFPAEGTHLQRYAGMFAGAEINASFYRPLRPELYAKWAASVPDHFRFAVKIPKAITHEQRLLDCDELLAAFLDQVVGLGDRLGCLLVQLPPSLEYDPSLAGAFFAVLRALHDGAVAVEPRHASWFTAAAADLLLEYDIARAAADPARVPEAAIPGGVPTVVYYRLHGSPRIYWSRYELTWLQALLSRLEETAVRASMAWCIFDNTASSSAIPNALELRAMLMERGLRA